MAQGDLFEIHGIFLHHANKHIDDTYFCILLHTMSLPLISTSNRQKKKLFKMHQIRMPANHLANNYYKQIIAYFNLMFDDYYLY